MFLNICTCVKMKRKKIDYDFILSYSTRFSSHKYYMEICIFSYKINLFDLDLKYYINFGDVKLEKHVLMTICVV